MAQRARREYLQLLDAAKLAAEAAIDAFNSVRRPYRTETTLLLFTNAWELLAKAVLLQLKRSISRGQRGETISAEVAVHRLVREKVLTEAQADTVQQLVSLRHAAAHHVLPPISCIRKPVLRRSRYRGLFARQCSRRPDNSTISGSGIRAASGFGAIRQHQTHQDSPGEDLHGD